LTAIQRGDRLTVNEYLNRGTNPNEILSNGASPLKSAVVSSNASVAELLLSRGADVNARDGTGKTALFWARRMNNQAMVQMLLNHGAQD
jgi:ankyrin repeat protein